MPDKSDTEDQLPKTNPSSTYQTKNFLRELWSKFRASLPGGRKNSSLSGFPDSEAFSAEKKFIQNYESFTEKTVEDIIIPRADITAVSLDVSLADLSKSITKHSHARTLVYKESLDNIIGFVHIQDVFEVIAKSRKYNLKKLIRKHIVSPHSMKLVDLLKQMQARRTHIAVVADEYGGTDGIVTISDIICVLVGRIDDEHDIVLESENYKIIKPGLVVADARMEVEELERILSVKLRNEDEEFDTVGGLLLARVGNIPEKGQIINIAAGITAEVMDATPRAVKRLKITCR